MGDGPARPRILIEALAARFGGTVYATAALAGALSRHPSVGGVDVVARKGSGLAREIGAEPGVGLVALRPRSHGELALRTLWQTFRLPRLVQAGGWDVAVSISGVVPVDPGVPTVCLLGNSLMYERDGFGQRLRRRAVARTSRRRDTILAAPTDALAARITSSTGRPCMTLRHGVDRFVFRPGAELGDELLCVADFYPHKRHDLVIAAWQRLAHPRPTLRLVGDPEVDRGCYARLLERVAGLDDPTAVKVDGVVAHRAMGEVYRKARSLIVASEHESFCLPVAEAMACGVPVIIRDIASLRETAGAGGVRVRGDTPDEWSRAMELVLGRRSGPLPGRETVLAAAARYSWEAAAETLLESAFTAAGR